MSDFELPRFIQDFGPGPEEFEPNFDEVMLDVMTGVNVERMVEMVEKGMEAEVGGWGGEEDGQVDESKKSNFGG